MLKRAFDIIFSLSVLIIGAPFLLLICLIIKLSSKGPVFYGGLRYGKNRKVFKCWKFRTMHMGAEEELAHLLTTHPALKEEFMRYRKMRQDPRTYPFGKLLRKYSLDELPQFFNVLIGNMTVVGPRAYLLSEVDNELGDAADEILRCRPGITGIWQTSGRNLLPFQKRIELDRSYIHKNSFLFDMRIILKTINKLFRPRGAF